MPAGVGVHDALQRNPDSQQPMARRGRRVKHGIDLRDHEIAQRACIESARRECASRLRQAGATEIRDQSLNQVHAQRDRNDAAKLRVQGQQYCRPATATAIQPVLILFVGIFGPRHRRPRLGLAQQLFRHQSRRYGRNGREAQPRATRELHARRWPLASQDFDEAAAIRCAGHA